MESPGLTWIPTGVGIGEPLLPRPPRDGPPVVLRDRRQRPGERAVHRRGAHRLPGPLRPRPAPGVALLDGPARPLDLPVLDELLLRDRLHPGRQLPRRPAQDDGLDRVLERDPGLPRRRTASSSPRRSACSTRSTTTRSKDLVPRYEPRFPRPVLAEPRAALDQMCAGRTLSANARGGDGDVRRSVRRLRLIPVHWRRLGWPSAPEPALTVVWRHI